jgi:serine/threonine protein kinase
MVFMASVLGRGEAELRAFSVPRRRNRGILPPVSDPYIGREVEKQFRIVERIGAGGMGSVYKAEQPDMNRFVAVKILHPRYAGRQDLVARFRREARAMSQLSHPNTARVFLYGVLEDGSCYFVMEHLVGKNLAQVVRSEGPMDPARAIRIMTQACGALEEAHHAGIVHRDLKPENIFLTSQGGITDFPKVLDFGLAKVTEKQMRPGSLVLTREGMVFGTPEFMSPEQARGKTLDARSDIYSLGIIFYELLTGKLPFEAKHSIEYIQLHVSTAPAPMSQRVPGLTFPPALDAAVARALAKDPDHRYPSAMAFASALQEALTPSSKPPPEPIYASQSQPRSVPPGSSSPGHSYSGPAYSSRGSSSESACCSPRQASPRS